MVYAYHLGNPPRDFNNKNNFSRESLLHTDYPSYLGGIDQEHGSKPAQANIHKILSQKLPNPK
jgi:hypothetical protein